MPKKFVNLKNAGTRADDTYKNAIKKIIGDGVCPFCPKNLTRYHKKPILKTGRYWILTENMYPYPGAKHHLLLIHKSHIERLSQITPAAWRELHALASFAEKKHSIKGGGFAMRFGNVTHTGASVSHLHAHIINPDIKRKNPHPIMFGIG